MAHEISLKALDAFFMSLGRSQRSKLRRKYKKVLNHFAGEVQVRWFCSLADLELAISAMEEIASKTDKRRVFGVGFFDTPQIREQMAVAAERGWLRIYILYLEEKPAAFWMGLSTTAVCRRTMWVTIPFGASFHPGFFSFSISSKTFAMRTSRSLISAVETASSNSVSATCGGLNHRSKFMRRRCVESN